VTLPCTLDKPYWQIAPQADLERVRDYITNRHASEATRASYEKGLVKLAEYLYHRCHRSPPEPRINWDTYVGPLPDWLADDVRAYVVHRRRAWLPDRWYRATIDLLSGLTRSLRWMAAHTTWGDIGNLTPTLWFDYVDERLAAGIKPTTLNSELWEFLDFLRFLAEEGRPICQRMLRVKPLTNGPRLPRDVPLDQLRRLRQGIDVDATSSHTGIRRMGIMDRAWFLLMLHSGLRVGEVRRLRLGDLELEGQRVRIEQSKGLKDRVVYLSQATVEALKEYLDIRGPAATDHVFIYRHLALTRTYCRNRLRTYGRRCGLQVTPHQLRHTCATLLLNAGAPILAVQTILGHKHIDTTLTYARLYDGTVAADYYRAMAEVEGRLGLRDSPADPVADTGEILALVEALSAGTLSETQREAMHALRLAILALTEQDESIQGDDA